MSSASQPDKLVANGGSARGVLEAAAVVQRPDLFGAAPVESPEAVAAPVESPEAVAAPVDPADPDAGPRPRPTLADPEASSDEESGDGEPAVA